MFKLTVADTVIYLALMLIFWAIIRHPEQGVGPLLNHRLVAWIGVLSYSLYLFHRLMIALVDHALDLPSPAIDGLSLVLSIAVAQARLHAGREALRRTAAAS